MRSCRWLKECGPGPFKNCRRDVSVPRAARAPHPVGTGPGGRLVRSCRGVEGCGLGPFMNSGVSDPRLQKTRIRNHNTDGQAATVAGYAGPGFHTWPPGHIDQTRNRKRYRNLLRSRSPSFVPPTDHAGTARFTGRSLRPWQPPLSGPKISRF